MPSEVVEDLLRAGARDVVDQVERGELLELLFAAATSLGVCVLPGAATSKQPQYAKLQAGVAVDAPRDRTLAEPLVGQAEDVSALVDRRAGWTA